MDTGTNTCPCGALFVECPNYRWYYIDCHGNHHPTMERLVRRMVFCVRRTAQKAIMRANRIQYESYIETDCVMECELPSVIRSLIIEYI